MKFIAKWCLVALLPVLPSALSAQNITSQSGFGTTIEFAGTDLLVSEPLNERISGRIYVYRKSGPQQDWMEVQVLSAFEGEPQDRFGVAIDADSTRIVTSATRQDDDAGAVFIFDRSADGLWTNSATIRIDSLGSGARFGAAVALSGDTVFASSTPFEGTGSVFVFAQGDTGDWRPVSTIRGDAEMDGNLFGSSLEALPGRLLIGSPGAGNGAVYVYAEDDASGDWMLRQSLNAGPLAGAGSQQELGIPGAPFGITRSNFFGASLAVHGPHLAVSAPNADNFTGLVYFYRQGPDGRFRESVRVHPFDAQPRHLFGRDVAITDRRLIIGAAGVDNYMGAIYVLDLDPTHGSFSASRKLRPTELVPATLYGSALAANGDVIVAGASFEHKGYGSAYVFEASSDGSWTEAAKLGSTLQVQVSSITGEEVQCDEGDAAGFGCKNVNLVSFISLRDLEAPRGVMMNDVWGWTDPDSGREYALAGRTDGASFIDISDPVNPVILGFLKRTEGSPQSTWRDIKVYKDHAFIVADGAGAHGMQIFDLTRLRDVQNPPVQFEPDAFYDKIHSAHNVVINEETGFAYTVGNRSGGETCAGGSHMINIQDPLNPSFAGCFAHVATGRTGTGYTHDAQCVVYTGPDERYRNHEICFAANETAVSIADVTDKDNPVAVAMGNYPNPGYTHQGWLSEDQRYFFVNDELDELNGKTDGTRTLIWDVAELDDPVLINEYVSENKASDHNLYVRGNFMYQSNYVSGLRIIDVSDVENPVEVGYFDTVNWGDDRPGFGGSWSNYPFFSSGVLVVTSGEEGVFLVKRSDVDI